MPERPAMRQPMFLTNGGTSMDRSKKLSRRSFLKQSATMVAAGITAPYIVPREVLGVAGKAGANDRVILGVIGIGNRAQQLSKFVTEDVRDGKIVAVADCYRARMEQAQQRLQKQWSSLSKTPWSMYDDYRKMLDKEKLDGVIVGTPDHGRVLPCIRACQAGLDVYAEKPLTLTIAEGRVLVNAARKYKRVFQVGSQQRTMEMNRFACELVRTGKLGKLKYVQGVKYPGPQRYEGLPEEPIPEGDNWDEWQGQAPARPFSRTLQFGWMQWRSYSGGEMTNWGAHGCDQVQWALGMSESGPVEIWPVTEGPSGKVSMRYANGVEVRYELDEGPFGGAVFVGEDCTMVIDRNTFTTDPPDFLKERPDSATAQIWEGPDWRAQPHLQNWIDCIRTRKRPNADVEIGFRSITVCHLANIAREIGRKIRWDPEKEIFHGDDEANAYLDRPKRKAYELPDPV
jgi:predicted dehydrogenase